MPTNMTRINRVKSPTPRSVVLAILAVSLPTALVAQDATATVNANVGQSASREWGFIYSRDSDFCWAESRLWRVFSDRTDTGIMLRLDRYLRDRTEDYLDWQLADPPGRSLKLSNPPLDHHFSFYYRSILTYEVGGRRVRHGGPSGVYQLTAYERKPPAPQVSVAQPYRDTYVFMEQGFLSRVAPETGSAAADFRLSIYARFRPPRGEEWGDWTESPMVLELPTGGLARAIYATRACADDFAE